jgi:hypothetical protein
MRAAVEASIFWSFDSCKQAIWQEEEAIVALTVVFRSSSFKPLTFQTRNTRSCSSIGKQQQLQETNKVAGT